MTRRIGRLAPRDEKALEEILNTHALDVIADPFIEDRAEEHSPSPRERRSGSVTPSGVFSTTGRNWTQRTLLVDEEPVDLHRMCRRKAFSVQSTSASMPAEHEGGCSPASRGRGSAPRPVAAVGVMQIRRAVNADPDGEVVLGKKAAPPLVKQRAVRLQVVDAAPAFGQVAVLESHHLPEELDTGERRLPAVPAEVHHRTRAGRDERGDVCLEHLASHPERLPGREECRLLEVVAVAAFEVADRSHWLGHDHERAGCAHDSRTEPS